MPNVMDYFKVMLVIQLFFSVAITGIAYTIPEPAKLQLSDYISLSQKMDMQKMNTDINGIVTQQKNVPIIEIGALLFYSGNILLDFFLNFAFAIPEMIGLITSAIFNIINFDSGLQTIIIMFIEIAFAVIYVLTLIQMVTGIRSGSMVT